MSQDEHAAKWSAVDKLDEIRKMLGIGVQGCVVSAVRHVIESGKSEIAKRDSVIESLEDTRDHLLRRIDRAERALLRAGFVDNGAQEWKPPVNVAMGELYQKLFALESVSDTVSSRVDTVLAEYAKLKAVAEGQDALISELRLTLADAINDKREERKRLTTERDAAELSAIYFAKRLESQCHAEER